MIFFSPFSSFLFYLGLEGVEGDGLLYLYI